MGAANSWRSRAEAGHNGSVTKRVLIIEDDPKLGAQILKRLTAEGYEPHWVEEGRLLARTELETFGLVILDLMLPGVYGMDILKHLRSSSDVPVLVLSARVDTADKIRALKLGADDYLTKPFWPEELIERVRARLRRPALARTTGTAIGNLFVDLSRREVLVNQERVDLTRSEFELLAQLVAQPGSAMTRRSLAERVLDPDRDASERTLDVHVSRLRRKLGPSIVIETVWGIGYRLRAGTGA
jgi:DNA-binding response OmpR family regulator